jgi:hypothetical protein
MIGTVGDMAKQLYCPLDPEEESKEWKLQNFSRSFICPPHKVLKLRAAGLSSVETDSYGIKESFQTKAAGKCLAELTENCFETHFQAELVCLQDQSPDVQGPVSIVLGIEKTLLQRPAGHCHQITVQPVSYQYRTYVGVRRTVLAVSSPSCSL